MTDTITISRADLEQALPHLRQKAVADSANCTAPETHYLMMLVARLGDAMSAADMERNRDA